MKQQKEKIIAGIALVAFIGAILLGGLHGTKKLNRYSAVYTDAFDTVTQIVSYEESQEEFQRKADLLHEELLRYHQLYDIYNCYDGITNLKTVNEAAKGVSVVVEADIIELLMFGKQMEELTHGKTNIAFGNVLVMWHDLRTKVNNGQQAMLPTEEDLREANLHTSLDQILVDKEKGTIIKNDEQLRLDVGSIAKGFAAQKVAKYAEKLGMSHLLLSVGGNVVTIGEKPDGEAFQVGIQNPDNPEEEDYVCRVLVRNQSLVTSGDYQRYFELKGRRYCHIIDPLTLYPAQYVRSVSVLTTDSGRADALSTGLFCMTLEEGKALVNELQDVEALWILEDGSIQASEGFPYNEYKR